MIEPSVHHRLVDYAALSRSDVVLDVGAGLGFLTRLLAGRCKRVLAVESDSRLVKLLRDQLKDMCNVEIVKGNVLKISTLHFNKVVSIPPYHISSPLLLWLFDKRFDCGALIFQREFANRFAASVGSENYGWLTVVTYYYAEVELLDDVPRWMFYPQPEVDSMIVRLKPRKPPPFNLKNKALFKQLVQALFTRRNRKVRNAVLPFLKRAQATAAETGVEAASLPFQDKRVRELAPEDFGALANALVR
ncbi:ribosomal RNA small subunit methyltransferase A [Candidatus Bathyarchaeota archaeon]|nr:ribosomal RNA small subunit methyltransferase A [Candidatus Bathyarchaeota archaeon]